MACGRLNKLYLPKRPESPETLGGFPLARGELAADRTAPTLTSATIRPDGVTLRLVFSAPVSGFSGASGFAMTGLTGGATTLSYSSGTGTATIDFTISRTVTSAETSGVLAYTPGSVVKVSNNVALASFSGTAVTNSSTQVAGPTVRNATTGTVPSGTNTVTLPTRASGDILIFIGAGGSSAPPVNTGWTSRVSALAGDSITPIFAYTKTSDGTDNVPFTGTVLANVPYTCFAIQNPASGFDVAGSSGASNTQSAVAPSVTTTATNDLLVTAGISIQSNVTITMPGGQTATAMVDSGAICLRCGSESLAASGATGTRTSTVNQIGSVGAINIAIK